MSQEPDDLEMPIIEMDPDALQLSIRAYDDAYFERHPGDDYYVRDAWDQEFAIGGAEDYKGLVLVYAIDAGARLRKPVTSVDEGMEFVVWYESVNQQD